MLRGVKDDDDGETEGSGFSATLMWPPLLFNLLCEEKKKKIKNNRSYILLCEAPLMPFLGELTCRESHQSGRQTLGKIFLGEKKKKKNV